MPRLACKWRDAAIPAGYRKSGMSVLKKLPPERSGGAA
jgi:hypothetical protein